MKPRHFFSITGSRSISIFAITALLARVSLSAIAANLPADPNQAGLITSYGLAPPNNLEAAIAVSLASGACTATVSGESNQTGVALVEVDDEQ
jgi:hypothetical protein